MNTRSPKHIAGPTTAAVDLGHVLPPRELGAVKTAMGKEHKIKVSSAEDKISAACSVRGLWSGPRRVNPFSLIIKVFLCNSNFAAITVPGKEASCTTV